MNKKITIKTIALATLMIYGNAFAQEAPVLQSWMNPDVGSAWSQGYKGQGTNVIVVDDFTSGSAYNGNFNGTNQFQRHGEWTREQINLVAPEANLNSISFNSSTPITLTSGLDIVNASYGLNAKSGYKLPQINFGGLHGSIINSAKNGEAVVVKAAGNNGVAVNSVYKKQSDYMNLALVGAPSAIFVGALNKNGTPESKAVIEKYSNTAGSNKVIQKQFLMVGVEGSKTGLYGTSFAAPVVSGYAAILGSKFTSATPTQITNQLLTTARTDTIKGYKAAIHGRGEASITRALAPVTIN